MKSQEIGIWHSWQLVCQWILFLLNQAEYTVLSWPLCGYMSWYLSIWLCHFWVDIPLACVGSLLEPLVSNLSVEMLIEDNLDPIENPPGFIGFPDWDCMFANRPNDLDKKLCHACFHCCFRDLSSWRTFWSSTLFPTLYLLCSAITVLRKVFGITDQISLERQA